MTPIHDHEINHKRNFDDYLQIALLLPILGFLPGAITWKCLTLAG